MILHLLCKRRNVNRNVFNDRKNLSATAGSVYDLLWVISKLLELLNKFENLDLYQNISRH